jgi:adenylate kinase
MDHGILVPDEVVIGMVENVVKANRGAKGFIFDGFPRTVAQAEALDDMLSHYDTGISVMVSLIVDQDELVHRLLGRGQTSGRTDDQDEKLILRRVQEYQEKTAPVADYYAASGRLQPVEGIGAIDDIFGRICEKVDAVVL